MKEKTLQALRKSIEHWEDNLRKAKEQQLPDISADSCALCSLFFRKNCEGCPIQQHTGKTICKDTPYYDVVNAISNVDDDFAPTSAQSKKIAKLCHKEIDFLKSLLPKEG